MAGSGRQGRQSSRAPVLRPQQQQRQERTPAGAAGRSTDSREPPQARQLGGPSTTGSGNAAAATATSSARVGVSAVIDSFVPTFAKLLPGLVSGTDTSSLRSILEHAAAQGPDRAGPYLADLVGVGAGASHPAEFVADFVSRLRRVSASDAAGTATVAAVQQLVVDGTSQDRHKTVPHRNDKQQQPGAQPTKGSNSGDNLRQKPERGTMVHQLLDQKPHQRGPKRDKAHLSTTKTLFAAGESKGSWSGKSVAGPSAGPGKIVIGGKAASKRDAGATTVKLSGGTPMKGGQGTTLDELDAAIQALEVAGLPAAGTQGPASTASAAPVTGSSSSRPVDPGRYCGCMARRHPLLSAAPNCLECGKIVCLAEGLAPCAFCGAALLQPGQVEELVGLLRRAHGQERMRLNNERQAGKRPAAAGSDQAFSNAVSLRDQLLQYQTENAARTRVRDEAADYDFDALAAAGADGTIGSLGFAAGAGGSAGPAAERAQKLRAQAVALARLRNAAERRARDPGGSRLLGEYDDVVGAAYGRAVAEAAAAEAAAAGGAGGAGGAGPAAQFDGRTGERGVFDDWAEHVPAGPGAAPAGPSGVAGAGAGAQGAPGENPFADLFGKGWRASFGDEGRAGAGSEEEKEGEGGGRREERLEFPTGAAGGCEDGLVTVVQNHYG